MFCYFLPLGYKTLITLPSGAISIPGSEENSIGRAGNQGIVRQCPYSLALDYWSLVTSA